MSTRAGIPFDRVLQVLAAGCARSERRILLGTYALFALTAALVAALVPHGEQAGTTITLLLALPTFFLWIGWISRLLLLRAQTDAMALPTARRDIGIALLAVAVATVLLPAAWCAAKGSAPGLAIGVLATSAGAGLLVALLPRGLAGLIGFLPMLFTVTGAPGRWVEGLDPAYTALAIALATWLLALVRWRAVVSRLPEWNDPSWRQPVVFAMARRGNFWGGGDLFDARVQAGALPYWWRRLDGLQSLGPEQPVRTLRSLLGGVLAPKGWRQRLAGYAIAGGVVLLVWRYALAREDDTPWQMMLFMALATGALMLLGPIPARIQALQQRHGGELVEVALLPGFGGPALARILLLQAIVQPYGAWCAALLVAMVVLALASGGAGVVVLAVASSLAMATLGAFAWLKPLAGRPWKPTIWTAIAALSVGIPLCTLTLMAFDGRPVLVPALLGWAGVLVLGAWLLHRAWRRFLSQPHPFLVQ